MYYLPTGLAALDTLLGGGIACGAITEIVGGREQTLRLAATVVCEQQRKHPYASTVWFDGAAELDEDQLQVLGLDPEKILLVTPDNFEITAPIFLTAEAIWAGFVLTGLPPAITGADDWVMSIRRVAATIDATTVFFLVLLTPLAVSRRSTRRALVRLRLARPVAAQNLDELIVALTKHWYAPVGCTARVPLLQSPRWDHV